jgi:hypothetical protein
MGPYPTIPFKSCIDLVCGRWMLGVTDKFCGGGCASVESNEANLDMRDEFVIIVIALMFLVMAVGN